MRTAEVRRRILKESLIVLGITLIFLVISATIGISTNPPPTPPTAEAAYETEHESENLRPDRELHPNPQHPIASHLLD
jgi:hypothetical protein